MQITKRNIAELSLEGLAIASYEFDPSASEWMSCVNRLELMMAEWDSKGIRVGYEFTDPLSPDDDSRLQMWAAFPVANNLALRIAPMFGVQPSPDIAKAAKEGLDAINLTTYSPVPYYYLQTTPRGAGWRWMRPWNRFYQVPSNGIDIQAGSPVIPPWNPTTPIPGQD